MSLTSLSFLGIYFPLIILGYFNPIIKSNRFRKILLLLISIALYTFGEPTYILLLLGIIIINYSLVTIADKCNSNVPRALAIIMDVGTLAFFKYINKILALGLIHSDYSSIVFPVGLSYFTFKAISYVVDSKKIKGGNIVDVAIYISNFITIVSGPMSTYEDELPTIIQKHELNFSDVYRATERIILGLAKKVIIADSLSLLVNQCFAEKEISLVMAWGGAIAYTLQLFFDFSGYTDMAIGVGCLLGFNLPENFNYPYMANSISDFWKRWHISLTKWFTKYIYIPLGGSRVKSTARHIFNLFVVWLVTGLWHGSIITFIIWAMIYFLLQLLEKYSNWAELLNRMHIGHIYTILIVIIEWVIFRSPSVGTGFRYVKSMFLLSGNEVISAGELGIISKYSIPFVLGIIFSTNIGIRIKTYMSKNNILNCLYNIILIVVFVICIIISISQGYSSPLYAGF